MTTNMIICKKIQKVVSSNKTKEVFLDGVEFTAELESMLPPISDLDPNEMTDVAFSVLTKGCTSYRDTHKKVITYRGRHYFIDTDRHFMALLKKKNE